MILYTKMISYLKPCLCECGANVENSGKQQKISTKTIPKIAFVALNRYIWNTKLMTANY